MQLFRPVSADRKRINVIPLITGAIVMTFGMREDGAFPLGAFYDKR